MIVRLIRGLNRYKLGTEVVREGRVTRSSLYSQKHTQYAIAVVWRWDRSVHSNYWTPVDHRQTSHRLSTALHNHTPLIGNYTIIIHTYVVNNITVNIIYNIKYLWQCTVNSIGIDYTTTAERLYQSKRHHTSMWKYFY